MRVEAAVIAGIPGLSEQPRRWTDRETGARVVEVAGYLFITLGLAPTAEELLGVVRRSVTTDIHGLSETEPGYFVAW